MRVMNMRLRVLSEREATQVRESLQISGQIGEAIGAGLDDVLRERGVIRACGPGCAWCCTHDEAWVTQVEAEGLYGMILDDPGYSDVIELVREKFERMVAEVARSGGAVSHSGRCVFLSQERTCRVYEHRPFSCRLAWSADAARCEAGAKVGDRSVWVDMPTAIEACHRVRIDDGGTGVAEEMVTGKQPLMLALALLIWPEAAERLASAAHEAKLRRFVR